MGGKQQGENTDNYGMRSERPMPQLPKLPPKPDLLKHFDKHCALVKLLALVLIVILEWGRAAVYAGVPTAAVLAVAKHWT